MAVRSCQVSSFLACHSRATASKVVVLAIYRLVSFLDPLGLGRINAAGELFARCCAPLARFEQAPFRVGAEREATLVAAGLLEFHPPQLRAGRHHLKVQYSPPPSDNLYGLSSGLAFRSCMSTRGGPILAFWGHPFLLVGGMLQRVPPKTREVNGRYQTRGHKKSRSPL